METAPLKAFASWARTALIREVAARVAVVLGPASPERVERPSAVDALQRAVDAAGGGEAGRASIADRVAYTWFNRIVALRFMDANGYTGVGVVSPRAAVPGGQPEILSDAKRGETDPKIVGANTRETVAALLDGVRRSEDPQGEAYALLLADYCRHWNRAMPFMFEREGDFTELLIPAGLLADGSVLHRAVAVLTDDVCADVEVIGWLYQFYIAERKSEVFAGFKNNRRAGADEIPAATQLFTPHWIVRYLVENSLGRLWMLNRPSSRLAERMDYYLAPSDEETDFLKVTGPEDLTVVDPACGSGHMLTYAFDLLYTIYEEEGYAPSDIPGLILRHNLYGTEIDARAGALAAFALTMKARARQRTFFGKRVAPNIRVLEPIVFTPGELDFLATPSGDRDREREFWNQFAHAGTLGALIRPEPVLLTRLGEHLATLDAGDDLFSDDVVARAERVVSQASYLTPRYAVVVANPPYMGRGNMGALLTEFVDRHHPTTSWGLDATFIDRAGSLVVGSGYSALVTMHSWMYLSSYEDFRREVLAKRAIVSLLHLGSGVFDSFGGEVVAVVASVFRHSAKPSRGSYVRLLDLPGDVERLAEFGAAARSVDHPRRFSRTSADFLTLRGALIAYFADSTISDFLERPPIRDYVEAGVGSQTGSNERFVRYWFEVAPDTVNRDGRAGVDARKWTPATKGGEFRRWYNPTVTVMDWRRNGGYLKEHSPGAVIRNAGLYFRENLSWTKVGSKLPSFRYSDASVVHNDASCFVVAGSVPLDSVAAYLNSRTVTSLVKELNPTLNLRPASLLDFPFVELGPANGKACRELSKRDWDRQELSLDYAGNVLIEHARGEPLAEVVAAVLRRDAATTAEFAELENTIEREVATAAGLAHPDEIPWHEHSLLINPAYRYGPGKTTAAYEALATTDLVRDLASHAVGCMFGRYRLDGFPADADNVIPIVDGDWFSDDIVARFRTFLRVAFGERHFEENLGFVTRSLGVRALRDYFVRSFYADHWKRYRKRPIYWLFSSPSGAFNALVSLHRYTPSTASTVLNEYLREYRAKLEASLQQHLRLAAGGGTPRQQATAQKEADRLRKVVLELEEYEHDVLYPLATRQLALDLDDGVRVNYRALGAALKRIPGLEAVE